MDAASLVNLLRTTAPSCLCGFRARPAQLPEPFDDNPHSVWKLVCRCGGEQGRFLGYPLRDYNREYDGPEFISPLAFERAACKTVSELLNTDQHGYHAEVARRSGGVGATHYRGQGPRQAFLSPHCGGQKFEVTVGFVFWYPDELAQAFDGDWEDLFSVFLCHCQCADCGQFTQATNFGKL